MLSFTQVFYLAKKMFPGESQFVNKTFECIIEQLGPYAYMAILTNLDNPLNHKFPLKARLFPFVNKFGEWEHSPLYYKPKAA